LMKEKWQPRSAAISLSSSFRPKPGTARAGTGRR
jgi:hypothetical protein